MGNRLIRVLTIAAALLIAPVTPSFAQSPTDANLITALDVSDSIMRHEEWLQFEGLAKAVVSATFLDAVARGYLGRIGFAVFTWSSDRRFDVLVPWTVIASAQDAERVAIALRGAPGIDRSAWARRGNGSDDQSPPGPDLRTDLSATIDFAAALAGICPYPSGRAMINISGNGNDNVGVEPDEARDRAVAAGMTINGLVIDAKDGLAAYYRDHIQGGPGSFVVEVKEPGRVGEAMLEKLLLDLVAARSPAIPAVPLT